jgi:hypothetical protein
MIQSHKIPKPTMLWVLHMLLPLLYRSELRALAKHYDVRRGRNTKDTIINLVQAVRDGKIEFNIDMFHGRVIK